MVDERNPLDHAQQTMGQLDILVECHAPDHGAKDNAQQTMGELDILGECNAPDHGAKNNLPCKFFFLLYLYNTYPHHKRSCLEPCFSRGKANKRLLKNSPNVIRDLIEPYTSQKITSASYQENIRTLY